MVKLETLQIGELHMMEEVVANEGGEEEEDGIISFCKLQHMELVDFLNLISFSSGGGYIFSFPSLEHMEVKGCPKMKIYLPAL